MRRRRLRQKAMGTPKNAGMPMRAKAMSLQSLSTSCHSLGSSRGQSHGSGSGGAGARRRPVSFLDGDAAALLRHDSSDPSVRATATSSGRSARVAAETTTTGVDAAAPLDLRLEPGFADGAGGSVAEVGAVRGAGDLGERRGGGVLQEDGDLPGGAAGPVEDEVGLGATPELGAVAEAVVADGGRGGSSGHSDASSRGWAMRRACGS